MSLYKFSPITNQASLIEAIGYVSNQTKKLVREVTGEDFLMTYLTIFSHYDEEFEKLQLLISELGTVAEANNGVTVLTNGNIGDVSEFRIRKPDPYRMHVGCADFNVENYYKFKNSYLNDSKNLRLNSKTRI